MNLLRLRALAIAAGVLVATAGLSGCTSDSHNLPSLEGTLTPTPSANLEAIAKTYYDCMMDAGISMDLEPNPSGQLSLVYVKDFSSYVMWRESEDDPGTSFTKAQDPADRDPAVQKAENDFFAQPYDGPALMIDGIDYSDDYAQCLAESGYNEQAAIGPLKPPDPALAEQQMASNNKWAVCARENGWPDVKDSVMPDENDPVWSPAVYLPVTITEDQLRQLLEACPNFDLDNAALKQQWYKDNPAATSNPDNWAPDPSIMFDITSVEDQADADRLTRLNDILNEQVNEYNAQHGG